MKALTQHGIRLAQYSCHLAYRSLRLASRLVWHAGIARSARPLCIAGEELALLCEDLGPTFVKMGQILSSRPDLIRPELASALARLQDKSRPFSEAEVSKILAHAYGGKAEFLFSNFNFTPIAAASIAQVHTATLRTGQRVAVKIRRPGIVLQVDRDMALIRACAGAVAALPFMKVVPLVDLVEEIATPIREQLDFAIEAENNRRLRRDFAAIERIRIPALIDDLCTADVLVMEFMEDLQKVGGNALTPYQKQVTALAGLRALYRMIFLNGFVHADMHPGNVFPRNQGELVILDTGLIARLSDKDRRDFTDFFFALANNDGKECARIVHDNAAYFSPRYSRPAFESEMQKLIARHSALKSSEFEVSAFVYQLIGLQRTAGVRGSTKFIMTILSMVVFDGICKQLYPDCEFLKESKPFLIAARYGGGRRLAMTI